MWGVVPHKLLIERVLKTTTICLHQRVRIAPGAAAVSEVIGVAAAGEPMNSELYSTMLFSIIIRKKASMSWHIYIYINAHFFLLMFFFEAVNAMENGGGGDAVTVGIEIVTDVTTSAADASDGTGVMMKGVHQTGGVTEEIQAMMKGARRTDGDEG